MKLVRVIHFVNELNVLYLSVKCSHVEAKKKTINFCGVAVSPELLGSCFG